MRWLRDNWIDALIFSVFAVTVVGIVLFLTGVNPFKGGITSSASKNTVTSQAANEHPQNKPAANSSVEAGKGAGAQTPSVTVVPLLPAAGNAPSASAGGNKPAGATQGSSPAHKPAAGARKPASAAKPAGASISVPAGPEKGVFRVSVGAFANPGNALALAEKLEARGFPVRLEPVGKVTRVAVGPFPSRTSAKNAADKLANYQPQIYRGDTPALEQAYLQVGAYKQLSSARPIVEKLKAAGIGPVVFYYQKPWLKVWIGPLEPSQIATLKARLKDAGFEAVEVR